jgi:hypothetical protein
MQAKNANMAVYLPGWSLRDLHLMLSSHVDQDQRKSRDKGFLTNLNFSTVPLMNKLHCKWLLLLGVMGN